MQGMSSLNRRPAAEWLVSTSSNSPVRAAVDRHISERRANKGRPVVEYGGAKGALYSKRKRRRLTRVVQVGLGPLGRQIVRYAVERHNIKVVGAVDPAPDIAGKELGELCGLKPLGIRVMPDLRSALNRRKADVALLTTVSSIERIAPQVVEMAKAGLDIVSTCEELVFPWRTAPAVAERIAAVCRKQGVTCLSTGVNPGFLMDFLPCALTAVCRRVEKIVVRRIQDASARRVPFQQKIGAGLSPAEFRKKKTAGTLRHVGLTESIHMIAHTLGWNLDRTTETLKPVTANRTITSGYTTIKPGMARGVEQFGRGYVGRKAVIVLRFRAAVGEPESYDSVEIFGEPNIRSVIPAGVNGDIATCAIVVNAVRSVVNAEPGLKTMLDMPALACSSGTI